MATWQAQRTKRALTQTLRERPRSAAAHAAVQPLPAPAVAVVEQVQVEEELMLAPFANRASRESLAEFQVCHYLI